VNPLLELDHIHLDYDTPRWGSPAERSRLLKKFDTEVKALPR